MAKQYDERFVIVHEGLMANKGQFPHAICIFVDKTTGVQYVSNRTAAGQGLTILTDQDGKPLLYQPPEE